MDAPWALRISAIAGLAGYVVLRALPLEHGRDPMSRAIALAALIVAPLALALLPPAGPRWARWHALVAVAQPVGALMVAIAISIPTGPIAGALAAAWMSASLLVAGLGIVRLRAARSADEIGFAAGPLMLPVGAAWLVASRMGLRPMGFDPVIVLLTAVHFHYTGLAMPILIALALRRVKHRALAAALVGLLAGIPIVAVGLTASPLLGLVGASIIAVSLLVYASVALVRVVRTMSRGISKAALVISLLSLFLSMPLAALWSLTQLAPDLAIPLDLDLMLRLHGQANAHGVVLLGLVAWALERPSA